MNKSELINELAAALAKAQGDMDAAKMDTKNQFGGKYADLGSIIGAAKKPLTSNGLSVSQHPELSDGKVTVTTILMHSSGQWLESSISAPIGDNRALSAAQQAGIVITYLRRYAFAAIVGIYADEDTDGASKTDKPAPVKVQADRNPAQAEQPAAQWPKPTVDMIVAKYKLTAPQHAIGMLNLSGMPHNAPVQELIDWCDEYRSYRMQVNEQGKQINSPERAAEMVAEARAERDDEAARQAENE